MRRRLLNFLTMLSLLLCVTVVVLWLRSYGRCDALVQPTRDGDRVCVTSEFGVIVFEWEAPTAGIVQPGWEYFPTPVPRRWPIGRGPRGVELYRGTVRHFVRLPPSAVYGFALPHWLLVLAAAILPGVALVRIGQRARRSRYLLAGLCPACGYDLRATASCCPECGTAAPASAPPITIDTDERGQQSL